MSLDTWKKEFYPIPAKECKKKDALEHSLKKWIGLRIKNLEKHGVIKKGFRIIEDLKDEYEYLHIADSSCALCIHYLNNEGIKCIKCPLSKSRNGTACDKGRSSPYENFTNHSEPEPMIRLIRKAIKQSKQKGK